MSTFTLQLHPQMDDYPRTSAALDSILSVKEKTSHSKGNYLPRIFEQSVTFVAQLEESSEMVPPLEKSFVLGNWRISENHIPIIVGISSGILILVLTLIVLVIWRCCVYKKHLDKNYEIHKSVDNLEQPIPTKSLANYPSVLVVTPPKPKSPYMAKHEIIHNNQPAIRTKQINRMSDDLSQIGQGSYVAFDIPDICDAGSPSGSGVMEGNKKLIYPAEEDPELRTRSLPSWVRAKTAGRGVGVAETDAAVGFRSAGIHKSQNILAAAAAAAAGGNATSSRRHQALCNDTAALIALSKARGVGGAQDRVSLVSNEAVVVLDERTAL